MSLEDSRASHQGMRDAPNHRRGLDAPAWLLVGQTGTVEYLAHRPQASASDYAHSHPVALPFYAELDVAATNVVLVATAVAAAPTGSNLPVEPAPIDVDMAANVATDPSSEAQRTSPHITLAPPTLEATATPGTKDDQANMVPPAL